MYYFSFSLLSSLSEYKTARSFFSFDIVLY